MESEPDGPAGWHESTDACYARCRPIPSDIPSAFSRSHCSQLLLFNGLRDFAGFGRRISGYVGDVSAARERADAAMSSVSSFVGKRMSRLPPGSRGAADFYRPTPSPSPANSPPPATPSTGPAVKPLLSQPRQIPPQIDPAPPAPPPAAAAANGPSATSRREAPSSNPAAKIALKRCTRTRAR